MSPLEPLDIKIVCDACRREVGAGRVVFLDGEIVDGALCLDCDTPENETRIQRGEIGPRSRAPDARELAEWVASLGCPEAPYVCGVCVVCRVRRYVLGWERCPGSGAPDRKSHDCPLCGQFIGSDRTVDARGTVDTLGEHWREPRQKESP